MCIHLQCKSIQPLRGSRPSAMLKRIALKAPTQSFQTISLFPDGPALSHPQTWERRISFFLAEGRTFIVEHYCVSTLKLKTSISSLYSASWPYPLTNHIHQEMSQEAWNDLSHHLQRTLKEYKRAVNENDRSTRERLDKMIPMLMRAAAEVAPDAQTAENLRGEATRWAHADEREREEMMNPLLVGLLAIVATPFALAAAGIVGAGAILYGAGKAAEGIGRGIAAGPQFLWEKFGDDDDQRSSCKEG
ncbi:hypothetical protein WOLCODRAFT_16224 [Wolfiporia cocos MD-104 SS10]|uniref:Uncharacterized protein n=1 Tax=Wolfiporia cocos (strain MD-104) TaxID=742152 RepID=A0A2H3JQD6_WOLCO|nr:hypothetical protein WOLCODRAFT_16224 [Wolfiporia cocos MD-104 SS10]